MSIRASDISGRISSFRSTLLAAPRRLVLFYSVLAILWIVGTSIIIEALQLPSWWYTFRSILIIIATAVSGWWFTKWLAQVAIQTQRLVSESEGDYRALFEVHPAPMWLYDKNTLFIIKANEAAHKAYGYNSAQFSKLKITDLYAASDKNDFYSGSDEVTGNNRRLSGIRKHINQAGDIMDVDVLCHENIFKYEPYGLLMAQNVSTHFELEKQLAQSLSQLEMAQHIAMMGYWERDIATLQTQWSPEIYSILGLENKDKPLTFEHFISFIHPNDQARMKRVYKEAPIRRQATHEYRVMRDSNEVRYIFERIQVVEDSVGKTQTLFGTLIDVSELKVTEQALARQQKRYEDMIDNLPDGVLIIRLGRVHYANAAACSMFGASPDFPLHTVDPAQFFHTEYRGREMDRLDALHKGLTQALPFRRLGLLRLDGTEFEAELAETLLEDELHDVQLLIRDVSQAQQMRHDLEAANESLQYLSQRLIEVQEAERRELARDLHDDIGQQLTGLKLHLQRLIRKLDHEADLKQLATNLGHSLDEALAKVRSLSLSLHPLQLETLGLEAAVRWHLSQFLSATPTQWDLQVEGMLEHLPSDKAVVTFRIIQEAVNNIARHAQADSVRVTLLFKQDQLRLEILDDGRGFDVQKAFRHARSLGLTSMLERVASLKGEMKISSLPGVGTRITVVLPASEAN